MAQKRRELRIAAIHSKGGYCQLCGYDGMRCVSAMHFHHTDPAEKDFSISTKLTSFEAIKAELIKCILLCNRCHSEVHDGLHPGFLDLGNDTSYEYDNYYEDDYEGN